ncbi:MAG: bifunctional hydroxymethylpyrimidine kinase/phosphomethylpyrimidine kinase [Myxococcales bacterium]|nr:bifunctional hydroxymethylpyrimidine kinase/phosphomethylpyrimidine kinase [Myxococcales bacterium]
MLAIGGLEPSGRAGLLADLEAIRACGALPLGIASALTAQGRRTFFVQKVAPRVLEPQIAALLELGPIHAVKLGAVATRAALVAIRRALAGCAGPWVVDPVVRASGGGRLSFLLARDYLALASPKVVITPNLLEARELLGWIRPLRGPEDAARAAVRLAELGFGGVVVKGGHGPGPAVDLVCAGRTTTALAAPRLRRTAWQRGTGCRFASATAVGLARGERLVDAARQAKALVRRFLAGPCTSGRRER